MSQNRKTKDPRLPELAGMTERGFNMVVDMLSPRLFASREAYNEWRRELPQTRSADERRAARRAHLQKREEA
jgi:hypothetical protein